MEIPKTSRAAVLVEYGKPVEMREIPIPEVGPGAVLTRNEMVGVCGTDIHQWHGRLIVKPPLPNIIGHETVGRIVKIGEGGKTDCVGQPLKVGDRVLWAHVDCGKCFWCRVSHQPTLCLNRIYYGMFCIDNYPYLVGGQAEYSYVLPGADMVKVPEELSNEEVVGVCCAFRSAVASFDRLGGIGIQEYVVILGAGPIGLYSLALAREGGAGRVIVIGAPKERLALAKKWGADYTINIEEVTDPAARREEVLKLTRGIGPDVVIDGTGMPPAFEQGLEMIRKGGRYLVIGQTSGGVTTPVAPAYIVAKQLDIIGSMSAEISSYYKALQFMVNTRHKYSYAAIITSKYPLEKATEALRAMESGKEIKAAILP